MTFWQDGELRALLRKAIDQQRPIILIILPQCQEVPQVPNFLKEVPRIDFRDPDPDLRILFPIVFFFSSFSRLTFRGKNHFSTGR
jgi:hypothetical protein